MPMFRETAGIRRATRYTVLLSFVLALSMAQIALAAERNIILFVADDLSPDAGCYGNPVVQSPHLDALANHSTLFTHAFATTASCSASRSVILTGLHNHSNGQYGHLHNYHKFDAHTWVQSLPVLLKKIGYRSARIGKYHVAPEDVFAFDQHLEINGLRNPVEMAERCRPFIEADSEEPFFLYLATGDPHRGGGVATNLPNLPNRFGNPKPGQQYAGVKEVKYDPADVLVPNFLPDSPECRAELAQYYQSASRVDQGLGRLVEILKKSGHWDDTLILFTSDHGMAFAGAKTTVYEPGLRVPFVVRDPYQTKQGERSDALVSLLDITPTLLDFAGGMDNQSGRPKDSDSQKWEWHTFLSDEERGDTTETGNMRWLPYTFHGRSFLPTLGQASTPGWDSITASHTFHEIQMYYPMRVYRDRQYKIIWNVAYQLPYPFASDLLNSTTWQSRYRQGPEALYGCRTVKAVMQHPKFELYDIKHDPDEKINLADDPEYADLLASYQEKLKAFQLESGDPWALKWAYE